MRGVSATTPESSSFAGAIHAPRASERRAIMPVAAPSGGVLRLNRPLPRAR